MIPYNTFAVIGGDLRQAHIANKLAAQGKQVYAMLLEENMALDPGLQSAQRAELILPRCDAAILPIPLTTDGKTIHAPFSKDRLSIRECFDSLKPDARVFAGKVDIVSTALAQRCGVYLTDYLEKEELAVQNAAITAEGAVAIAIEEQPIALFDSKVLIAGHGRIAKVLMRIMSAFGAHVSVAARKFSDLAEIRTLGCEAVPISALKQTVPDMDLVFNTVPAQIFTRNILKCLKPGALVIDLASNPGGVEFDAARELGIKTIWALSLPGKTAPISAGNIILETIENCLAQEEVR